MKQEYFVVVLAHSLRGSLRRIHIPHTAVYAVLALALLGCFSVFGFVASYARMAWKVANYNALKSEADSLRSRYQNLQKVVSQTNEQLASLEVYAKEVSLAYGIKQKLEGPSDIRLRRQTGPRLLPRACRIMTFCAAPTYCSLPERRSRRSADRSDMQPNLWPVEGRLIGRVRPPHRPVLRVKAPFTKAWISAPPRALRCASPPMASWYTREMVRAAIGRW